MTYAAATQLREAGYPESVIEQVTAIRLQIDECCRGRGALDETRALIDGVRSEPWFASANLPSPTSSGDSGGASWISTSGRPSAG